MREVFTRYSAEDLLEFDLLIAEKLESSRFELRNMLQSISRRNDSGNEFAPSENRSLDDGADSAEKEKLNSMAARLQKFIQQLEFAAIRIKNGTYGICIDTGVLIPKERLRAVPHTQHSIEAKRAKI
jgi:DnaK suppressor protein